MKIGRMLVAVPILAWLSATLVAGPTTRPISEFADNERQAELDKLDADYRARKRVILEQYIDRLGADKKAAVCARDTDTAEEIFKKIIDTTEQIEKLRDQPVKLLPQNEFKLVVEDFNGAGGFMELVTIDSRNLKVVMENDFGRPPEELLSKPLGATQSNELYQFLQEFPLKTLEDRYVDKREFDGLQLTFEIEVGQSPKRRIVLSNRRQPDLERLLDKLNDILPPRLALSRPNDDP